MSTTGTRSGPERAGLGARLREARERRNLSLQVVAERTKIPATNLDALEHDQVNRLPGGIFARSFVRAYAREVGLDPEEAVREFVRMHPEHAPPDAQTGEEEEAVEAAASGTFGRVLVAVVAVAVLAAVGVAAYRWLQQGPSVPAAQQEVPATTSERESTPPPESSPEETAPAAEAVPADAGGVSEDVASPAPPEEPPSPDVAAAGAELTQAPPTAEPAPGLADTGIRLEIHPSAPCWVRVVADGRLRLERLVQPGERPVIVAADGLELQVGDAGAFAYTINGQPGRSLGPAGRVVRATIARDTVADFVAR